MELRSPTEQLSRARIVVGVDGSPASIEALRWACAQARLTGGYVEAITAWQYPPSYGDWPCSLSYDEYEAQTGKDLERIVHEVLADAPAVEVRRTVGDGNAARVLLDAARGAQLLVVGNRGHNGFTEALLGSVGQHCVHHATCPVVIVRPRTV